MFDKRIEELQKEMQNTIQAMQNVKGQISVFNKKGEELAAHATFLNGQIEGIKTMKELYLSEDVEKEEVLKED